MRAAFAASLLLAVLLPDAALAQAASRTCRQLEAQLASLSGGGGASSTQTRKYDDAIDRQRGQIDKARGQARQAGCGLAMASGAVAICGEINAALARMEKNLSALQRQRTKLSGGDSRRERARIAAALDRGGCRAAPGPARPAPVDADAPPRGQMTTARAGISAGSMSGQFRTMCVRTCDGYYFPVSWSVSQAAFARDGNACQAMCPGAQVELHYHRVSGEDSEDMVSAATGIPYREMDNAFLYRRPGASIPAGCGCGAAAEGARGFQTIGGDYAANAPAAQSARGEEGEDETVTAAIPLPSTRPDPAEDPETLSTREGGLDADGLRALATPSPAKAAGPAGKSGERPRERPVRVVGPAFLPDREAAIDLQAQDPARAR